MRTSASAAMLALAILGGCASQGSREDGQSDNRYRAATHTELGASYYSRAQMGVALQELNEAVQADPSYSQAYNVRGLIYMELRENNEAEQDFQQALRLDPGNSEAHNNYGWFLCQQGRVDESLVHFMAALKNPLYTTPEKSYLNAGICSLKKQDVKSAEDFFHKALKLQPLLPQALQHLAEIYFERGNYTSARNYLEQLMQNSEPAPDRLWLAVRTARRQGDKNAEASYGLLLRKKFPGSPEAAALRNGQY